MPTPHNQAVKGDFADVVLMPGDPLRAKLIAETYLDEPKLVNEVRGTLGFTGFYKGKRLSVMSSGMGMPSMGIYSYELFKEYDVNTIIRIGSAGSYTSELDLGDVVLAEYSWTESTFAKVQNGSTAQTAYPSERLNDLIQSTARRLGETVTPAPVHCTDVFYKSGAADFETVMAEHGCRCIEMESFALFHNAKALGKNAACLLTISDSFVSKKEMSAAERQNSFVKMFKIALESAAACAG